MNDAETNNSERRRELADFLRTRRARLSPAHAGLGETPRRRTPGLRREEVAALADIGITWYTWLEQGRDIQVSADMLERVAGVLQLTADERLALFLLARQHPPPAAPAEAAVTPALRRFLECHPNPAFITNRRWDVVAWNKEASLLLGNIDAYPPEQRNVVWLIFSDPWPRRVFADWENVAQRALALFRLDCARHPGESGGLIERLQAASPEFRQWWPRHDVTGSPHSRKELNHPQKGRLIFEPLIFHPQEAPSLRVSVYALIIEREPNGGKPDE